MRTTYDLFSWLCYGAHEKIDHNLRGLTINF